MVTELKGALFLQKNFHEFFIFGHLKMSNFYFIEKEFPKKSASLILEHNAAKSNFW